MARSTTRSSPPASATWSPVASLCAWFGHLILRRDGLRTRPVRITRSRSDRSGIARKRGQLDQLALVRERRAADAVVGEREALAEPDATAALVGLAVGDQEGEAARRLGVGCVRRVRAS